MRRISDLAPQAAELWDADWCQRPVVLCWANSGVEQTERAQLQGACQWSAILKKNWRRNDDALQTADGTVV